MNWVIIAGAQKKSEGCLLADFLKNKECTYCLFEMAVPDSKYAGSKKNSEDISKLRDLLENATQCVILDIHNIEPSIPFFYSLGFLAGRSIPVFITGKVNPLMDIIFNSFNQPFENSVLLLEHLEEVFPQFIKADLQNAARKKMFSLGIPLTPDAFSQHICADHIDICALFYEAGMDVNACDSSGTPMLCVAARGEKLFMADWLIKKGADINQKSLDRGYTPLMDAVWKNSYDLTHLFVTAGADLNAVAKDGQPLLVLAAGIGDIHICKLLAENGANPLLKDNMGISALDYARIFKKEVLLEIFTAVVL